MKKIIIFLLCVCSCLLCMGCKNTNNKNYVYKGENTVLSQQEYEILEVKQAKGINTLDSFKISINGDVYSYMDPDVFNPWEGAVFGGGEHSMDICTINSGIISSTECKIRISAYDENALFAHLFQISEAIDEDDSAIEIDCFLKKDLEYFPSFDILNTIDIFEYDIAGNEINSRLDIIDEELANDIITVFSEEGVVASNSIENNSGKYVVWMTDDVNNNVYDTDLYYTDNLGVKLCIISCGDKYYIESIRPNYYNEVPTELMEKLTR